MRRVLIIAALVLSGCVTPTVTKKTTESINFSQFKTVSYRVHASPTTEYGDDEEAHKYGADTISLFDSLLSSRLTRMGYRIVPQPESADLNVDVTVNTVKPGSRAARMWIGFGAGRAVTLFDASFTNPQGGVVASFEGGRSYTGMELNVSPWAGKSDISASAATRCVDQIETFMVNGGSFPKK